MRLFDRLFGSQNNKTKKKSKNNRSNNSNKKKNNQNSKNNHNKNNKNSKKKPTAIFSNQRSGKPKIPNSKTVYSQSKFEEKFGTQMPKFRKSVKANVIMMYDPNVTDGEDSPNQETFIHYLEVNKKVIFDYLPPTPPKGVHNYYSYSMSIPNKSILEKLQTLDPENRKPKEIQKLHQEQILFDFKVLGGHVLRMNHFKVKSN